MQDPRQPGTYDIGDPRFRRLKGVQGRRTLARRDDIGIATRVCRPDHRRERIPSA